MDILPDWLGDHAEASAHATETPLIMAGLLNLTVVATAVAKQYCVSPEAGYYEPLNIWAAPAMESGNRKTSVLTAAIAPLIEFEASEALRLQPDIDRLASERKNSESRIARLRRKLARADTPELRAEIVGLESQLPEPLVAPRLITGDITPEEAAVLLATHNERIGILSDEGGIFDVMGSFTAAAPPISISSFKAIAGVLSAWIAEGGAPSHPEQRTYHHGPVATAGSTSWRGSKARFPWPRITCSIPLCPATIAIRLQNACAQSDFRRNG